MRKKNKLKTETVKYKDETIATGVAPLPLLSPSEQDHKKSEKGKPSTWPKKTKPGQCLCGVPSYQWHMECYLSVPPIKGSARSVFARDAVK